MIVLVIMLVQEVDVVEVEVDFLIHQFILVEVEVE